MILVGNQRGGSTDMARHLMNSDNERVQVHEIRGFMGNDLHSAFQESYAISRATKCRQHLYSLSLNPPMDANISEGKFVATIDRAEERLGLTGQPRAIVFHEKRGADGELRRHAHVVWCRIDTDNMRAVQMSFHHRKLEKLAHELFLEHGWELPAGFANKQDRDPLNFSHAEHQQAKRVHKDAREIKSIFQQAWTSSDSSSSFASALKEHGYILARGDRRGFVAVDAQGEVYAVARFIGIRTKEVRTRFGELDDLPSVEQAHDIAVQLVVSPAVQFNQSATQDNSVLKSHFSNNTTAPLDREAFFEKRRRQSSEHLQSIEDGPTARRVRRDPDLVLAMLTEKESIFTRNDIAKMLGTYIQDPQVYHAALATVLLSKSLVEIQAEETEPRRLARYSTNELYALELEMMDNARTLAYRNGFAVRPPNVIMAIRQEDIRLRKDAGVRLSGEQQQAIRHITGSEQLSCVVGVAGAGKSTILSAAREAWEKEGRRVFGAALAGKAAKGLETASGIQSRTLASFELSWQNDLHILQKGDVLVIDEAGMIGSRQMGRFVSEAMAKGAKLVLVGDAEQLQPIEAGAPFRAISETVGSAALTEVHRQRASWQKRASQNFAQGKTQEALDAYAKHSAIKLRPSSDDAINALVRDYVADRDNHGDQSSRLALAHRKVDVRDLNTQIREQLKRSGELQNEVSFATEHSKRRFASGDRLLFTRNDRDLGVKNGMLGKVVKATKGSISVELDDKGNDGQLQLLTFNPRAYTHFDHGYATTIHKSQGATVDRSFVLASDTMDRHLTYVAMTRHKQAGKLYAAQDRFESVEALANRLSRARQKQSTLDFENDAKHAFKTCRQSQHQLSLSSSRFSSVRRNDQGPAPGM